MGLIKLGHEDSDMIRNILQMTYERPASIWGYDVIAH